MQKAHVRNLEFCCPVNNKEDAIFLDDMIDLFMGMNGGHVGKYCYDGSNWDAVIENSTKYYVPRADNELVLQASAEIRDFVPQQTPYVDFGVGGTVAFKHHVLPIINRLNSPLYVGVDFCESALDSIASIQRDEDQGFAVQTVQMDFFAPNSRILTSTPSLGVMNGLTVTNKYGTLRDMNVASDFARDLDQLCRLTNFGWLLLTIDTNQDETSLRDAYETPMTSRLYLNVFHRMANTLPVNDFDPSLFVYEPEWHPELHLFAHMAKATEAQSFSLGSHHFSVKKGEKIHLLNSYKFNKDFFDSCSNKAGLRVQKIWHHETPMKLYMLAGKNADRKMQ